MATRKKKPIPLTTAEVDTAKTEVTAFYDEHITRATQEVDKAQAALARAEANSAAAIKARTAWTERSEITSPTASPHDPMSTDYTYLITEIAHSAGSRARSLAKPIIEARYGDANGVRRSVTADRQAAAEAAFTRAEILRRWLRESGYPMLDLN